MTLATGNPIKRRNQCAFTLVEMILVMVLLVVAVSLVAPKLSGFMRERALDSEARRMFAIMHAGQARAVSEGMPVMLWIDEKKNGYGIEEETPAKKTDPQAESYTADENVQVSVMNLSGSAITFNNLPAIRFLADGTVDENSPQAVKLTGSTGNELWLLESADRRGYEISNSDKL
ncbi:MAG TPA: GspH/FimT family pseudopilin [Verrucomicrobiae bacterium]|jgi:type II secretion system protein H|nr:GspH/FimT family pseudopilin [Verrucomicrobiae bacterium]